MYFQMEDVESKLDMFMEMYKEDRRWQQQLFQLHHTTNPPDDKDPPDSPPPSSYNKTHTISALPRLRSILIEKPISEPNTPISKNPDKPMTRNLSDLGPRIKKRVTYRTLSSSSEICETPPSILKKPMLQRGQTQMEEFTFQSEDIPDSSPEQSLDSKNESQEELIDFKDPEPDPLSHSQQQHIEIIPHHTAETSFMDDDDDEELEGVQTFRECNSSDSCVTVAAISDTEDCLTTEDGAGASDSLLPARNNNTKDSLAHKFHMKPESQALLMRPEVLKLRKTTC